MNLVILVKVKPINLPRLYKTDSFDHIPTHDELRAIGADINDKRGDQVHIEQVSETLWYALGATWIRPYERKE